MSEFHSRDGFYFERLENGDVRIRRYESATVLSPSEWASVVAHVSTVGDNHIGHPAALRFHMTGDSRERQQRARREINPPLPDPFESRP